MFLGEIKMNEDKMQCSLTIGNIWIVILGTYLFILITIVVCYVTIYKTVIAAS